MLALRIDERRTRHIFRDVEGHFRHDTPVNRQALLDVASNPANLVGTDRFGNSWFAETRADGAQVWAQSRQNMIVNGGLNRAPQDFHVPSQPAGPLSDKGQ
jgi:filamentous hemagglutinin